MNDNNSEKHSRSRMARQIVRHVREQENRAKWQTEEYLSGTTDSNRPYVRYTNVLGRPETYDQTLFPASSLIRHISKHKRRQEPFRILDYGCGAFELARNVREHFGANDVELTGMTVGDPRTEEQKKFQASNDIKYIASRRSSFPLLVREKRQFDLIVSHLTLQHVVHPLRHLERLYGLLAPGGELRCDLDIPALLSLVGEGNAAVNEKILKEMFLALQEQGIKVDATDTHIFLQKPISGGEKLSLSRWYDVIPPVEKGNSERNIVPFGPRIVLYKLRRPTST